MKKIGIMALIVVMIVSMSACNNSADTSADANGTDATADSSAETREITDAYGRVVEIPTKVERIVPLGGAPRMVAYLGLADKVVGIPGCCAEADSPIQAYSYVNMDKWKNLPNVGNDALGAGEWYAEEIIACDPDVILCDYTKDVVDDIQSQTGIPVVAAAYGSELFSEQYDDSLKIFGDACGVSDRAEEVVSYIHECLDDVGKRTADVPDKEKPTVLAAGATFKGGHSIDGVYENYPVFEALSANDVAVDLSDSTVSGGLMVDREQILAWDPDIIFFDAGNVELVKEDYNKDPGYFKQLKAVENGELYMWPNSTWHWSNVEIPLVSTYYVGSLLYPEEFEDVDLEAKASEIFDFFLGEPDYLTTLTDAGVGYEKVSLGE